MSTTSHRLVQKIRILSTSGLFSVAEAISRKNDYTITKYAKEKNADLHVY